MTLLGSEGKTKSPPGSCKDPVVHAQPLPLPPHAEIQLELQEQEMLKLERFGKLLAGPNTDLGKTYYLKLNKRSVLRRQSRDTN